MRFEADEGDGVDGGRVVQIVTVLPDGGKAFGSGYLLTPSLALTADHVVRGTSAQSARMFPQRGSAPFVEVSAHVTVAVPEIDVALLRLARFDAPAPLRSVAFGRVPTPGSEGAPYRTVGFPVFKFRDPGAGPAYRDSHDASGAARPLSNLRDGTLEISVEPPNWRPGGGESPWSGMSGAAVFCHGHLVGVVSQHDPASPRTGSLLASRVDRWYSRCGAGTGFTRLRALAGLPETAEALADPVSAWHAAQARAALQHRQYDSAVDHIGRALSQPSAHPELHYLLALALLRGTAPRNHGSVERMCEHLRVAASLPHARALHLLINEDHGARGSRGLRPGEDSVRLLAAMVRPAVAREICQQFQAPSSVVWRALCRRGQGGTR
ncbi:trypsin-like peptidase domain-containing protein [Catellatospora paridis]|uniref:trypsin-like peptidase domain-containing protein n=1 Tax=Catellatospora paridis TaxID=1617086 RepID=UPI0012D3ABD9|nr:trypsin-like peptidase domain-containing protein [Catellatospora paridis]